MGGWSVSTRGPKVMVDGGKAVRWMVGDLKSSPICQGKKSSIFGNQILPSPRTLKKVLRAEQSHLSGRNMMGEDFESSRHSMNVLELPPNRPTAGNRSSGCESAHRRVNRYVGVWKKILDMWCYSEGSPRIQNDHGFWVCHVLCEIDVSVSI